MDAEGRCVATDHGAFVLFNVYVPVGRDEDRLVFKQARRGRGIALAATLAVAPRLGLSIAALLRHAGAAMSLAGAGRAQRRHRGRPEHGRARD